MTSDPTELDVEKEEKDEEEQPFSEGNQDSLEGWGKGRTEETGRKLIPKNRYNVTITKAEIAVNEEKPYMRQLVCMFSIQGQDAPIMSRFFLCNHDYLEKEFSQARARNDEDGTKEWGNRLKWAKRVEQEEVNVLLAAVGLKPNFEVKKAIFLDNDTAPLVNKTFSVRVGHEKDDEFGDREKIVNSSIQKAR